MNNLFAGLFFLSLLAIIIGLISPGKVLKWGKIRSRPRVLITYGALAFIFAILIGVTTPTPVVKTTAPAQASAKEANAQNPTTSKATNTTTPKPQQVTTSVATSPAPTVQAKINETYPFETPDTYKDQNAAKYALAQYVLAWKNKDWNTMANYVQSSWKQGVTDVPSQLETRYSLFAIKGFKITNFESHSSWLSTISFDLWFSFGNEQVVQRHVTATVVNESDFNGVNPDSIRGLN